MVDVIKPITTTPAFVETRLLRLIVENHLDATGMPGTPGKYKATLITVGEQLDSSYTAILADGAPIRTSKKPISFDPMTYSEVQVTREDGSTFYMGQMFSDLIACIDSLKAGLPILPEPEIPQIPEPEPVIEE